MWAWCRIRKTHDKFESIPTVYKINDDKKSNRNNGTFWLAWLNYLKGATQNESKQDVESKWIELFYRKHFTYLKEKQIKWLESLRCNAKWLKASKRLENNLLSKWIESPETFHFARERKFMTWKKINEVAANSTESHFNEVLQTNFQFTKLNVLFFVRRCGWSRSLFFNSPNQSQFF